MIEAGGIFTAASCSASIRPDFVSTTANDACTVAALLMKTQIKKQQDHMRSPAEHFCLTKPSSLLCRVRIKLLLEL